MLNPQWMAACSLLWPQGKWRGAPPEMDGELGNAIQIAQKFKRGEGCRSTPRSISRNGEVLQCHPCAALGELRSLRALQEHLLAIQSFFRFEGKTQVKPALPINSKNRLGN
jgi:hypothetical protein